MLNLHASSAMLLGVLEVPCQCVASLFAFCTGVSRVLCTGAKTRTKIDPQYALSEAQAGVSHVLQPLQMHCMKLVYIGSFPCGLLCMQGSPSLVRVPLGTPQWPLEGSNTRCVVKVAITAPTR